MSSCFSLLAWLILTLSAILPERWKDSPSPLKRIGVLWSFICMKAIRNEQFSRIVISEDPPLHLYIVRSVLGVLTLQTQRGEPPALSGHHTPLTAEKHHHSHLKKKNECGKYMQYAEFHISVPVNHSETTLTGTRNFSSLFSLDQSSTQRRISKYLLYFQLVVQTAGVLSSAEMLHEQIPPTEPLLTIRNSSHSFPYLNPLI